MSKDAKNNKLKETENNQENGKIVPAVVGEVPAEFYYTQAQSPVKETRKKQVLKIVQFLL